MRFAARVTALLCALSSLFFVGINSASAENHANCVIYPSKQAQSLTAARAKSYVGLRFARGSVQPVSTDASYGFGNAAARKEVAQAFYAQNPDVYDFLYVFSSFDYPMPADVSGVYSGVRNDVQGINVPQFDLGSAYGSTSQLKRCWGKASIRAAIRSHLLSRYV